jgi:5-hydroxyisourate hydrolase
VYYKCYRLIFKLFLKVLFGKSTLDFSRRAAILGQTRRKADDMANAKGFLTTHVLDTARGVPAGGLAIDLYRIIGDSRTHLCSMTTNADGRTDSPILPVADFATGEYELLFHAGAYLDATGTPPETPRFLDTVPVRFGISDPDSHYHVPLLLSPFGYSTYRGS